MGLDYGRTESKSYLSFPTQEVNQPGTNSQFQLAKGDSPCSCSLINSGSACLPLLFICTPHKTGEVYVSDRR